VYLGRQDGYLHKIDCENRRRTWSLFLGDHTYAGLAVSGDRNLPEFAITAPILATPTLNKNRLYVGTSEGYMYCVSDLSQESAVT
jgi:hypothetical protein